jgi:hypothetical protein
MLQDGIKNAIQAVGYSAEVAELIDTDALLDDNGALDRHKLQEAITSTARKYNIARKGRALQPNPQQGAYGSPQRQPDAGFRAAFAPRSR